MIRPKSSPAGSVPNASPRSPSSRETQNASATAGSPYRTRSDAWSATAIRSTSRRARASIASEPPLVAARLPDLAEQRLHRLRLARHGAQDVEADDVARPLPDRVERRLAVEARHHGLLDVAVPAEALERLGDVHRRPLADPVLDHRR